MSGTERPSGSESAASGGDPARGFVAELAQAFRRYRPQGSVRWNFADAFSRLERLVSAGKAEGAAEADAESGGPDHKDDGRAETARPGRARRLLDRSLGGRLAVNHAADAGAEVTRTTPTLVAGLDATLEGFRFLAARVERLEERVASRRAAVDAVAWLVPSPSLGPLAGPVADWTAGAAGHGVVVHGECGDGQLTVALSAAGLSVRGAEPRGAVAWQAAERGVDVHFGAVEQLLAAVAPRTLGGLVLSGVVDRLALEDTLALLALATECLADGAPLVVIGSSPTSIDSTWDAVARDLVPGRPLDPQTWEFLLDRAGYDDAGPLPGVRHPSLYAVKGRRPR